MVDFKIKHKIKNLKHIFLFKNEPLNWSGPMNPDLLNCVMPLFSPLASPKFLDAFGWGLRVRRFSSLSSCSFKDFKYISSIGDRMSFSLNSSILS